MDKNSLEYQQGFKDGFCQALDNIIDAARSQQTRYEQLFNSIKTYVEEKKE